MYYKINSWHPEKLDAILNDPIMDLDDEEFDPADEEDEKPVKKPAGKNHRERRRNKL